MKGSVQAVAVISIAMPLAGVSFAQSVYVRPAYQFPGQPAAGGPATIRVAETPLYMTPFLGAGAGYDDNLFLSHTNEKASAIYLLSPGLKLDARDPNKVFQFNYQGQLARYASSSDDNYVDHAARAQFDIAFDRRNFLKLGYDYIRSHDPRGSTDRPIAGSPDKYRQSNPNATYAFGAPGAMGRVEVYYSDPDRRYLNNRDFTTNSDRTMQEYGGAFYWRAMPRTYVLAEARETNIRYKASSSPFDADERRYYAGVMWEATGATTGTLKFGQLRRDFASDTQPDFTGSSWEGLVTWAPRTYSKFDFYTARQTNESTGLGNFILISIAGVTWTHAWTSYISTSFDARYQKDQYQAFDRNDRITVLGVKAGYRLRRWLTLGAEYSHTQRDSNVPVFEYDKNLYLLTATASM